MLSNTLNTNEVKNASGAEVEFQHLSQEARTRSFAQIAEVPSRPHRLSIAHREVGAGFKLTRQSKVGFTKTVISDVDNVTPVTITCNVTMNIPVGAMGAITEAANVLAEALSFCASDGTSTTILYAGTGNGASALLNGSL